MIKNDKLNQITFKNFEEIYGPMSKLHHHFNDALFQSWGFQTEGFPIEDFSLQDKREPEVFYPVEKAEYLVFIKNVKDEDWDFGQFSIMVPYISKEKKKRPRYGWLPRNCSIIFEASQLIDLLKQ